MAKLFYCLIGGPLAGHVGLYRGDLAACNGGRGPRVIEPTKQIHQAVNESVRAAMGRGEDALPVLARGSGKYWATGRRNRNQRAEYQWRQNGEAEG